MGVFVSSARCSKVRRAIAAAAEIVRGVRWGEANEEAQYIVSRLLLLRIQINSDEQ